MAARVHEELGGPVRVEGGLPAAEALGFPLPPDCIGPAADEGHATGPVGPRLPAETLGSQSGSYPLASLRYDLSKLRAKPLVERLSKSHRYRLFPQGSSACLVFLKLFARR